MATLEYTASIASGMLTNVQYTVMGNKRVFVAHYSSPSGDSGYIRTGMPVIDLGAIENSDIDACYAATTTVGMGMNYHFSGHAAGDTGIIWIIGD